MIQGIQLKVCGLTSLVDAEAADACGADYLGFVLYPASPRCVAPEQFAAMSPRLPPRRKVAVSVEPSAGDVASQRAAGFDFFQFHCRLEFPLERLAACIEAAGRERVWLAPKLPPGADVPQAWLESADTFLLDAFSADKFGGTGLTGDWHKFARHRAAFPGKKWILSGGLNAENIAAALEQTGAGFVDVNSGVESAPGVKDPEKLKRFAAALRRTSPTH